MSDTTTTTTKLFANMAFLIIDSREIHKLIPDLKKSLKAGNADHIEVKSDKAKSSISLIDKINDFTHVISNDVGFKDYAICEEAMIPVVTPEWVFECERQAKLISLRPYNPDPKFFFKSAVITVSNELGHSGDKEAIHGAVRALGGQFSDQLLLTTTHLIASKIDEDLCCVARECNQNGDSKIMIVTPNWIDDCLKLRKRLDEQEYLLDGTGTTTDQDKRKWLKDIDVRKSHVEKAASASASAVVVPFLENTVIYIGKDLDLSESLYETIATMIRSAKGIVTDDLQSSNVTTYVGKYREGDEYLQASRRGMIVGNLNWIYYMMANNCWISPTTKLLHYPFVKSGLSGMDKFIIGVTNYTGDGRFYLESLIKAMGGTFTKNLKITNTHLICAKPVGRKYEAAKFWSKNNGGGDVKIVNHLWLEESYRKWKILDEEFPRFKHFPRELDFGQILGKTGLDELVLKQFYREFDSNAEIISDSLASSPTRQTNSNNTAEEEQIQVQEDLISTKKKRRSSIDVVKNDKNTEANTSVQEVHDEPKKKKTKKQDPDDNNKENVQLSEQPHIFGSKRSAKLKAAVKLHSDMEDLNDYLANNKNKKKVDSPMNGNGQAKGQANGQSKGKGTDGYNIDVIVTGCEQQFELNEENIEKLQNKGINVIYDFESIIDDEKSKRSLYLVAPKVLRTEKFLTSLSYELEDVIVPEFLQDVVIQAAAAAESKTVISIDDYKLKDRIDFDKERTKLKEIWGNPNSDKIDALLKKDSTKSIFHDYDIIIFQMQQADNAKNLAYRRILLKHGVNNCEIVTKKSELEKKISTEFKGKDKVKVLSKKKIGNKKLDQLVVDYDWIVKKIMLEITE